MDTCKLKVKFILEQAMKTQKETFTSTLSLTSRLDVYGWLRTRSGHFTPWLDTRYPLYRRPGCASETVRTGVEILAPYRYSIAGPSSP